MDSGEPMLSGIQVQLVKQGTGVIASNFTDGAGTWTFYNLLYGNYSVNAILPNNTWSFSPLTSSGSQITPPGSGLTGSTFSYSFPTTPASYSFIGGMYMPNSLYYLAPRNSDSCLTTTTGSNLALGETVYLYSTVYLSETTPQSTLKISVSGDMQILNATTLIGSG
jgi:hypothetical protein